MSKIGKFLFLGTGASAGVPVIGCKCAVCASTSPYNHRLRPSGLLKIGGHNLLIDVGPDFRTQALKHKIDTLDGLLLTHTHYDHIAGIDDLRIYYLRSGKPLPCLLSRETFKELKDRYHYFFRPVNHAPTLSAQFEFHLLDKEMGEAEFVQTKIGYMSYFQGKMKVNGFRVGDFAYVSDLRDYDASIFAALKGVRKLVLNALQEDPSEIHLTLDEAVAFAEKVGAEETRLTHISHGLEHTGTNRKLPPKIQLGFDGLEMEFHES